MRTQARPAYLFELRRATITGEVLVDFYVKTDGTVANAVALRFRDARVSAEIRPAWDPRLRDDEDRVPRKECYLKDFRPLVLGTMRLEPGRGNLTLRATKVATRVVAEVFRVTLRRVAEAGPRPAGDLADEKRPPGRGSSSS